jgi:hypothetical protein
MTAIASNFSFVCAGISAQLAAVLLTGDRNNLAPAGWMFTFVHNTVRHGDPFCGAVEHPGFSRQLFARDPANFDLVHDLSTPGKRLRDSKSGFVLLFAADTPHQHDRAIVSLDAYACTRKRRFRAQAVMDDLLDVGSGQLL